MSDEADRLFEAIDPTGSSTIARCALTAAQSGFDGIVLRDEPGDFGSHDLGRIGRTFDLTVVPGATVRAADRGRAGSEIARRRPTTTVLFGAAAENDLRHFLAGQERLDVLAVPGTDAGSVGHTTVQRAAKHGIFIEIDLGPALRQRGGTRVRAIAGLRRLLRFVEHADCPYVVTGSPTSHLEIRGPRDLVGVGETIGLSPRRIEAGLAAWGTIIDRTDRARDDRLIEPGVERLDHEADDR